MEKSVKHFGVVGFIFVMIGLILTFSLHSFGVIFDAISFLFSLIGFILSFIQFKVNKNTLSKAGLIIGLLMILISAFNIYSWFWVMDALRSYIPNYN